MTSIDTWPLWIAMMVTGGPILLAVAGITFSLYLSRRHLGSMREALKNSRFIYIWGTSLGKRGVIWSLWEISKIAGMVTMPNASIRIGELDPVDLKNFPPYLKRLLTINMMMLIGSVAWSVVAALLVKLR
ncbi:MULTISPECIES: hypothetical protein [Pseudomonas]|uniref:Uncharacterized protein n=1 Tax=Pseudomonas paralactis TaxID=1615673 RepID=A0A0R3AKT3_9PSED|nr:MULTISPECIES: hypothetical protein [Pseudomonas]KRP71057.1 hypothetical protein TX23_16835 [Pseudomonas paralactis]MBJ2216815.1 hypothetical protein [Pseudomonas sp. MF7453]